MTVIERDNKKNVRSPDLGLNIGFGVDLKNNLGFAFQYGIGFINIGKESRSTNINSNFGMSLRYMFSSK
ncbi:MAG: hypothetical protein EYC69_10050 [Bacteroidetes bacterium]|nr:MAG: hypothetical protein EYC69_10050 [Bacteroidota bacterium]